MIIDTTQSNAWIVYYSDLECANVRGIYATEQQAQDAIIANVLPEHRFAYRPEQYALGKWAEVEAKHDAMAIDYRLR